MTAAADSPERAQQVHAAELLPKPFDLAALFMVLGRCRATEPPPAAVLAADAGAADPSLPPDLRPPPGSSREPSGQGAEDGGSPHVLVQSQ
jgi:hypothetical protein